MIEFVGNCNHLINWDEIILSLDQQDPAYIGPRHRENDPIKGISDIAESWKQSGYVIAEKGGNVGWDMFFPEKNFNNKVVKVFSDFVGIEPVNCWISRVHPGMFAPWHWDANDREEDYNKLADMLRFSCHISRPTPGHVFIVEGTCFYNEKQGNIYKWPSRKSYHAGGNCGLIPKYLFNIFGHKK